MSRGWHSRLTSAYTYTHIYTHSRQRLLGVRARLLRCSTARSREGAGSMTAVRLFCRRSSTALAIQCPRQITPPPPLPLRLLHQDNRLFHIRVTSCCWRARWGYREGGRRAVHTCARARAIYLCASLYSMRGSHICRGVFSEN